MTAGERRVVSALMADVYGSTAIGERLGPERSKFLFDEIVRLMRDEVERFGGTVAQLTGDGLFALFGTPTAHEDDAIRAVRAALALQDSLARYGAEVGPAYGIELSARVAINTGPVVVPDGDLSPETLYNALGDTVNVAARPQTLGDIVVGPVTAREVEGSFDLEELGEVELKGKTLPVRAYRVTGVRETPAVRIEEPFVGREEELGALNEPNPDIDLCRSGGDSARRDSPDALRVVDSVDARGAPCRGTVWPAWCLREHLAHRVG